MDANKGTAEQCLEIARGHLKKGNFALALKMLTKSKRLYPLAGVDALIKRAESSLASAGTKAAEMRQRKNAASNQRSDPAKAAPTRPYTAEQVDIVRRIKRQGKDHYGVLGCDKSASESELKKAYRKLALKLHPDKNTAPGADDAFKAVGTAYGILSDADKRAHYDKYGDDDAPEHPVFRRRRGGHHAHYQEVDPDEIFNMFFGGGLHGGNRGGFRTHNFNTGGGQQQGRQRQQAQQGGIMQLLQLMPLIILFGLTFLSNPMGEDNHVFSMTQRPPFNVKRYTQSSYAEEIKVPYYVKSDFASKYQRDRSYIYRLEAMVKRHHKVALHERCGQERERQRRMIIKARGEKDRSRREKAMKKALSYKLKSCEEYERMPG